MLEKRLSFRAYHARALAAAMVFLIFGAGCSTFSRPVDSKIWPAPAEPKALLMAGDVVAVKFPYAPELNEEQSIRPDGKISLQLVDETAAAGLTPSELRDRLLRQYDSVLKDPELTVIVRSYQSQRVYVTGEVLQPGMVPIEGRLTVMEAIAQAGGHLRESADLKRVVVMRLRDDVYYLRTVNLKKKVLSPESESLFLDRYDIVFVPRTTIDRIDQWVSQHIDELIPEDVVLTFNYSLNNNNSRQDTREFTFSP